MPPGRLPRRGTRGGRPWAGYGERCVATAALTQTQATPGGTVQQRTIGTRQVSAIGLGGMPMSIEGRPDEARSMRTIHAALDAGVTLIDTADAYHRDAGEVGHNESLIARALEAWSGDRGAVVVATK